MRISYTNVSVEHGYMDLPDTYPQETDPPQHGGLIRTANYEAALSELPHETQLTTMRQMMETLFSRIDALQQTQAVQLAGVHDRLDAVELEIPLIQEQSALRIRDLETRMTAEIQEATRAVVDEMSAGFQEEVAGRLSTLMAQIESQRNDLTHMCDSKRDVESKLDRAVRDIERLCGNLAPPAPAPVKPAAAAPAVPVPAAPATRAVEVSQPQSAEPAASPYKVRISEHIRKAAIEAAPQASNPLVGQPAARTPAPPPAPLPPPRPAPASPTPATVAARSEDKNATAPAFDDWKRRFMHSTDHLSLPKLGEPPHHELIACPRCYSVLTRPATPNRVDALLRLAGMYPHRCRSCSHRFYKKGVPGTELPADEHETARSSEMMEIR